MQQDDHPFSIEPAEHPSSLAAPEQARPRILIIDDEAGPRESIRVSLENLYECTAVEDGYQGIALLDTFRPDLIVLDIRMPRIDGIETLRRLREKDGDVEVVLLTAYGSLDTAQKAIRYGVFDYIEKPFDLHALRATVARGIERRRRRVQRDLRYEDMEQMLSRLKQDLSSFDRLARIGQLSAGIVHEMKNPLTVILGYTQILMGRLQKERNGQANGLALSEESSRYLALIEQETMRCTQIAQQLLLYSRAPRDERQRTTLYEIITNIQMLIQPQCSVNDVVLGAEPPVESVMVHINIGQLHDVLLNLCMNAMEAMAGPGTLRIVGRITARDGSGLDDVTEVERRLLDTTEAEQFAAIEVSDSGPGIAPEHLPQIFEPFFTTKDEGEGTGLGLPICREHIATHGGTIDVARTGPDGTTFRILLPAL
ncbi:MAG: response regulator [Verrucomicrobia bacterium]|nr:response regulator [Verrucomicrobiota bacterium]